MEVVEVCLFFSQVGKRTSVCSNMMYGRAMANFFVAPFEQKQIDAARPPKVSTRDGSKRQARGVQSCCSVFRVCHRHADRIRNSPCFFTGPILRFAFKVHSSMCITACCFSVLVDMPAQHFSLCSRLKLVWLTLCDPSPNGIILALEASYVRLISKIFVSFLVFL